MCSVQGLRLRLHVYFEFNFQGWILGLKYKVKFYGKILLLTLNIKGQG
jgi:hypothetical protein